MCDVETVMHRVGRERNNKHNIIHQHDGTVTGGTRKSNNKYASHTTGPPYRELNMQSQSKENMGCFMQTKCKR